jgi:O-antigen/teichoic acid export membrane protein
MTKEHVFKKVVKNIAANSSFFFINLIIAFFLTPFIIHKLGDSNYGIWILVGSLTGYFGLLQLGINPSLVKYTAEYYASKDFRKLNQIISTTLLFYLITGFIVLIIGFVLALFVDRIFEVKPSLVIPLKYVLILSTIDIAIAFPGNIFSGIIHGFQKYYLRTYYGLILILLRAFLVVLFLNMGYGLVALAVITVSTNIICNIIDFIVAKVVYPHMKFSLIHVNKNAFRLIFSYSFFTFIGVIAKRLIYYTDSIVIGFFLPVSLITHYAVAWKLIRYMRSLSENATGVLVPTASELGARDDNKRLQKLYLKGTQMSVLLCLPIALIYLAHGDTFFKLWIGPSYASSYIYLTVLTIPHIFVISQHTGVSIMFGLGKHKIYAVISFITALANLVLSIILVQYYGLLGVALGTAIPMIVFDVVILTLYYLRSLNLSVREYLLSGWSKMLIYSLPLLLLLGLLRNVRFKSLYIFITVMGLWTLIFWVFSFIVAVEPTDKKSIVNLLKVRVEAD